MKSLLTVGVVLLCVAARAEDPATDPLLPKGATAMLYSVTIDHEGKAIDEPIDTQLWTSLEDYKRFDLLLAGDSNPDSDNAKQREEFERDRREKRLMVEVRPKTRVKILDWKIFVADTPENRADLKTIDTIQDRQDKIDALATIASRTYRVEILNGNYKGRKGWVPDYVVFRTIPKKQ